MKYTLKPTSKFQKDLKRIQKRGYDIKLLKEVLGKLANGEILPAKTEIIICLEIIVIAGNAILRLTGY